MLGLWRIPSTTKLNQVDDFGKSISNPLVFSAPAQAPKGTLTNTREGEVFVLKTLKFKHDVCLEPGKISSRCHQIWAAQNDSKCMEPLHQIQHLSGCPLPIMLKEDATLNFLRSFFMFLLLGARRPILPSSHVSNVSSYRNLTSPANKQNCKMSMALGNESPTFKSLRGNKSTHAGSLWSNNSNSSS